MVPPFAWLWIGMLSNLTRINVNCTFIESVDLKLCCLVQIFNKYFLVPQKIMKIIAIFSLWSSQGMVYKFPGNMDLNSLYTWSPLLKPTEYCRVCLSGESVHPQVAHSYKTHGARKATYWFRRDIQEDTEGNEGNADGKEGREHCVGSQDGLPGWQLLLLELGVWNVTKNTDWKVSGM